MVWADVLTPAIAVALVSTFFTLLLRGDIRLGRELTRIEAESAKMIQDTKDALREERDQKRVLQERLDSSAIANADLQTATAETARQQAAVIDMLLKRTGGAL